MRDLLTLMIIISDNTATDIMVDYLGGAGVIEGYMHKLGLTDIFFKWNCKELLRFAFPPEVADLPLEELVKWTMKNDILGAMDWRSARGRRITSAQAQCDERTAAYNVRRFVPAGCAGGRL